MGQSFDEIVKAESNRFNRMMRLMHEANTKNLRILEATYGAQGWNWRDKPPVVKDVTAILNARIKGSNLAIPRNYNAIFGDPKRGVLKQLVINFCYKGKLGYTFVDEGTVIRDLVSYVKQREEAEHQAEAEYEWNARRPAHIR